MEKSTFFVLTVIIALLPRCYSSDVHTVPARKCIFGPFRDTAMNCWLREGKFTGCILKDFDWFSDGSDEKNLSERKVLDSFRLFVKIKKYRVIIDTLVRRCVETANFHGSNRIQAADELVGCFHIHKAFTEIFPKAFCKEQDDGRNTASPMGVIVNCAWGPFRGNVKKCYFSTGIHSSCILDDLGFFQFTEDHKVDMTKLLEAVDSYIINSECKADIDTVMRKCVTQANSVNGTQTEVGNELTNCWKTENVYLLFVDAFCPKSQPLVGYDFPIDWVKNIA